MAQPQSNISIKIAIGALFFLIVGLFLDSVVTDTHKKIEKNKKGVPFELVSLKQPEQWLPKLAELREINQDKHEIVEFFWYGCSHCFTLAPSLQNFEKQLPENWRFIAIPAAFGSWEQDGKLFYALQELGIEADIRIALMTEMQADIVEMHTEEGLTKFFVKHNIEAAKVIELMREEKIITKANIAGNLFYESMGVLSVPSFVIDGKILVLPESSPESTLNALNAIVQNTSK